MRLFQVFEVVDTFIFLISVRKKIKNIQNDIYNIKNHDSNL